MTLIMWLIFYTIFVIAATVATLALFLNPKLPEALQILRNGFREGLRGGGLAEKPRYPVELWVWETMDDDEVCEDCLERASWPPMDIADWMKEGLPGTPESETGCRHECRCRLVPYNPQKSTRRHWH